MVHVPLYLVGAQLPEFYQYLQDCGIRVLGPLGPPLARFVHEISGVFTVVRYGEQVRCS